MEIESNPHIIYKDDDVYCRKSTRGILGAVDHDLIAQEDKVDEYS